jgi:hypothetical protein
MLMAGERRAVEEALVETHVLVRTQALVREELVAGVDHQDLRAGLDVIALHARRGDVACAADGNLLHPAGPAQENLS